MDVFYPVRKAKILQLSFSTKRNPSMKSNGLDNKRFGSGLKTKNPSATNEWILVKFS